MPGVILSTIYLLAAATEQMEKYFENKQVKRPSFSDERVQKEKIVVVFTTIFRHYRVPEMEITIVVVGLVKSVIQLTDAYEMVEMVLPPS